MQIANASDVFEALAARGRIPRLRNTVGTWQIEVDDAGTWSINVNRGNLTIKEGKDPAANVRARFAEPEFVRLARGDDHENLLTAALRGALLAFEGDIPFAQKLQAILPLSDVDERSGT